MNTAHFVEPTPHPPTNPTAEGSLAVIPIRGLAKLILIVDDNPIVRAALRLFIENHTRMRACEARDGAEAVDLAAVQKPDVVIMDLVMPNMNGLEAASAIRSRVPNAHMVVFTLHSDVIGKGLAKAIGVDVVVPKSEGAMGLIKALEAIWAESAA